MAFDGSQVSVDDLIAVIEGVEEAHGLAGEGFPDDRPEHPADMEPLQRQIIALGAAVAGLGLGVAGRLARAAPLPAELVSVISLADSTPAVRHRLESWVIPSPRWTWRRAMRWPKG